MNTDLKAVVTKGQLLQHLEEMDITERNLRDDAARFAMQADMVQEMKIKLRVRFKDVLNNYKDDEAK